MKPKKHEATPLHAVIASLEARRLELPGLVEAVRSRKGQAALAAALNPQAAPELDELDRQLAVLEREQADTEAALGEARRQQTQAKTHATLEAAERALQQFPTACDAVASAYTRVADAIIKLDEAYDEASRAEATVNGIVDAAIPFAPSEGDVYDRQFDRFSATHGVRVLLQRFRITGESIAPAVVRDLIDDHVGSRIHRVPEKARQRIASLTAKLGR